MKLDNKDIIQGYIFTVARFDFSLYERRILYRICEIAQEYIEGKELKGKIIIDSDLEYLPVNLPLSSFLGRDKDDKNYMNAKNAIRRLQNKQFEYETADIWKPINLIDRPVLRKRETMVSFDVHRDVFNAMVDFSKGFRKYELKTIFELKSVYAMRFYELFSNQSKSITYSVEQIKGMFKIESKYERINDLRKYVLDKAKKELDKNSPYSFRYEPLKTGRRITAFKFTPYFIAKNQDPQLETKRLQQQVSVSFQLNKNIVDYLRTYFQFTPDEIKRNIDLFGMANDNIDFLNWMSGIKGRANDAKNPKGYMINALKGHLKDPKNFTKS